MAATPWSVVRYHFTAFIRFVASAVAASLFASGWIEGKQTYLGRPTDIIQAKDGSILIADDWAGAIYRISYDKANASTKNKKK